jgi:hypothetical protein
MFESQNLEDAYLNPNWQEAMQVELDALHE